MESLLSHSPEGIACLISFLLGSVPFGLIVARLFKVKDLTKRGSGNIGATNVSRVLGFWPAGAITFALDVIKGAIPVALVSEVGVAFWQEPIGIGALEFSEAIRWVVGLSAIAGHCYSPWLRFQGGKGVATGFGALSFLSPWGALAGIAAFGVTFLLHRIGSLASLAGLLTASAVHLVLNPGGDYLLPGALMVSIVVLRHEPNLDRLLEDREKAV